jgi:putative transposase
MAKVVLVLKINLLPQILIDPEVTPYWNDFCASVSEVLPVYLEAQSVEPGSWFSIARSFDAQIDPDSLKPASFKILRSRKIRVYPTAEQRQAYKSLFGATRFGYNSTIAYLRSPGTKANWVGIRKHITESMPNWTNSVPVQPKDQSINDACKAVKAAKKKFKLTGQFQEVRFRSKKNPNQNAFIPKTAVTEKGIYHTMFGKLLVSEKIPKAEHDCRLVLQNDRYFLIIPQDVDAEACENQAGFVALDPGLRTFLVAYSERGVEEYGAAAYSRISRLCHALDELIGRTVKASGASKRRMKKAQMRLRNRIRDSVAELHHKVACFLTRTYKVIAIPEFNFHPMSGKLFRKTVRGLATLAHGKFRQILASHAEKRSCKIVSQNEAYTSKTCSSCGHIQEIGSASRWKCHDCGIRHNRDINGARGIFLRALRDNSWIREHVSCISEA